MNMITDYKSTPQVIFSGKTQPKSNVRAKIKYFEKNVYKFGDLFLEDPVKAKEVLWKGIRRQFTKMFKR